MQRSHITMRYTLYKNPVQMDTLAIVKYLYYIGKPILPTVIVEHGWPEGLELPCIFDHQACKLYQGIEECLKFYEHETGEDAGLLDRALQFVNANPTYRIR